jgi:hypothetical protein
MIEQSMRRVRGVLFRDYVRMLRAMKDAPYGNVLTADDLRFLESKIDLDGWYPMESFERLGNAILRFVCRGELFPVQLWGRYSAAPLRTLYPTLVVPGDPAETLRRFDALRPQFFDFGPIAMPLIGETEAQLMIAYQMGMPAEEAASHQTLGFCEGLLQLAGAIDVDGAFRERSWLDQPRTLVALRWRLPAQSR